MPGISQKFQRIKPHLYNTFWLLAERGLRIFISIFLFAYIARYLGPQDFGLLNYAFVFSGLFVPLISLGLNRILVRELVKDRQASAELLGTVFGLRLGAALVSFLVLLLIIIVFDLVPRDAHGLMIIAGLGNLFLAFDVIELFFQSQTAAKYSVQYKSIAFLLVSFFKVSLIFSGASVIYFAWVGALELFLIALLALFFYRKNVDAKICWTFSRIQAKNLLLESWPEALSAVAILLCMRLDQIMLTAMVSVESMAVFSTAVRLTDAWYFIPAAVVNSTFPAIMTSKLKSQVEYLSSLQNLFMLLVLMSFLVILPTMCLAPVIIQVLFGVEYAKASTVLMIYIWGLLFVALGMCSGSWIFAESKVKLALYRTSVGTITNFLLNYLLIPKYGAVGAAMATVCSLAIAFYLFDLFHPAMRSLFFMKTRALWLKGLPTYIKGFMA
ncbi:flippase [Zooshikella harenae]|uniref:Flippase n=1 Tax=Zooshikella harenae TaxID=2827238 RepID=A0ABS5ZD84_9GAMM|nr:flippase [Zooshikella harenae]MBU2711723.1 flippase [Zooshikella harenae]